VRDVPPELQRLPRFHQAIPQTVPRATGRLALRRARRFLIVPGSIMLCIAIWLTHGKESSR
jgi:hypothetical protein